MEFRRVYGIDTGTSTVKIYSKSKNKIYTEKNMIAVRNGRKVIAVGDEAYEMFEKAPSNVEVDSPMAFGMIADITKMEAVLYSLMRSLNKNSTLGGIIYFAIPMDLSQIEKKAYDSIANGSWMRNNKVYMVEKPIADAIALGISISSTKGSMIVNIGDQSTEISIIVDGKVIISKILPIGGKQMDYAICDEIRKEYNLQVGTRTARRLKLSMGDLGFRKTEGRKAYGIDSLSGLPRNETITSRVVNTALENPVREIGDEIRSFLERIPPQVSYQILKEGILLTGGSTQLPMIDRYLADYIGYGVRVSELYELCTVTGLKEIIQNKPLQKWASPFKRRSV